MKRSSTAALATSDLSPLFLAAIEATEEAIYNSLFAATSAVGPRGAVAALPLEETLEILRAYRVRD